MSFEEIVKLIEVMHKFRVGSFRLDGLDIVMWEDKDSPVMEEMEVAQVDIDAPIAVDDDPIKHKIEQAASLMKLNDRELVDVLFPDENPDGEEQ